MSRTSPGKKAQEVRVLDKCTALGAKAHTKATGNRHGVVCDRGMQCDMGSSSLPSRPLTHWVEHLAAGEEMHRVR